MLVKLTQVFITHIFLDLGNIVIHFSNLESWHSQAIFSGTNIKTMYVMLHKLIYFSNDCEPIVKYLLYESIMDGK